MGEVQLRPDICWAGAEERQPPQCPPGSSICGHLSGFSHKMAQLSKRSAFPASLKPSRAAGLVLAEGLWAE